jgi:hypothetical protein
MPLRVHFIPDSLRESVDLFSETTLRPNHRYAVAWMIMWSGQVRKTPSLPLVPPYSLHTNSAEPTKDKSLCSTKVASEKDAVSAQIKLGQLQPFIAAFPQGRMHGPTRIFWSNPTPFSLKTRVR